MDYGVVDLNEEHFIDVISNITSFIGTIEDVCADINSASSCLSFFFIN